MLKQKRKIMMLVALAFITASTSRAVAVMAAEPQTSEANISFKENSGPTDPVDPEDPSKPNPEEPGTGAPGPLSINHISNLPFGLDNMISNMEAIYHTTNDKPYLQVTDLRGTGAGWKVTASSTGFKALDAEEGSQVETLKGTKVILKDGKPLSANPALAAPTIPSKIELMPDNHDVLVASAGANAGMGTWVIQWFTDGTSFEDVELVVPAGTALVGEHKATITWNLSDAP